MSNVVEICELIIAIIGVASTIITAIISAVKVVKAKAAKAKAEKTSLLKELVQQGVEIAEQENKSGKSKKKIAISTVEKLAAENDIDIEGLGEDVSDLIEKAVAFANKFSKKNK